MAQSASLKKANQYYDNLSYANAIPEYKKALKSDSTNSEAIIRLAHCYRLVNNSVEAENWYGKVVRMKNAQPQHYLYYAQACMSNGNYAEAEKWITNYKEKNGNDERASRMIESLHQINRLYEDSTNFKIVKLSINSEHSDFCPVYFDEGLVFASARNRTEIIQRTHDWTGMPYFSLYYAKGSELTFSQPKPFAPSINTRYNNGPVCFSKSGDYIYVTRNNVEEGRVKESDSGIVKLKIYILKRNGNDWENETSFDYNSDNYSCAHPCISADGNKLYFASDMPGGYGGMDIYVSTREGKKWGKPVNLGPSVNTSGNEGFPYIDSKKGLFFASNGRGGLGGFDIYYSPKSMNGFSTPVNLGYPINSPGDDFSWIQNEAGTFGYFTSNRETKGENDEIYSFKRMSVILNVLVYDSRTKLPLPYSEIKIIEAGTQRNVDMTSDSGRTSIFLTPGKKYHIVTEKDKYSADTTDFIASDQPNKVSDLSISLDRQYVRNFIAGRITATEDSIGVSGALVKITNKRTGEVRTTYTNADGSYRFDSLDLDNQYELEASVNDCITKQPNISTGNLAENEMANTNLSMDCLVDVVRLANIYYDLNKFNIRKDAEPELLKLAKLMKSNPSMKIELRSHTDCRGSRQYNQYLSEMRVKSAIAFLTKNGIKSSQMIGRGYGETKPVNNCECEGTQRSDCTAEQHQANRRTEFKVLTMKPQIELSQSKPKGSTK